MNFLQKNRYIGKLITTTPHWQWIVFLQIVSGTLGVVGLPLLVPVLNYLKEAGAGPQGNSQVLAILEHVLRTCGFEVNFNTVLATAAVLIFTSQALVFVSNLIAANAQTVLCERYRMAILRAYGDAQWLALISHRTGEVNYTVLQETISASVAHLNAQRVLINVIQVIMLLLVALGLSVTVTLIAFVVYGLMMMMATTNAASVQRLAKDYNAHFKGLANDMAVLQQNRKFLKTALRHQGFINDIHKRIVTLKDNIIRQNIRIEGQQLLSLSLATCFLVGLMFFHDQLHLSYAVLLLVLFVFLRLAPQFAALSVAYATLDSNIPMHHSLKERINLLCQAVESSGPRLFDSTQDIRFSDVVFTYPGGNIVFEKMNAIIEPCRTTAFIGPSGTGKSTLLDLLLGLLAPQSGVIYYGNVSHDELDKGSLRSQISYVSQDTTLIDGTIKDNLTIGAMTVDESMINDVLHKVGLFDYVQNLSEGLNTSIGENGVNLSGGQRQRLAIARALLSAPRILILDEATSALDNTTEKIIHETLGLLKHQLTIIVITHRVHMVSGFDRIYRLEEGGTCSVVTQAMLLGKNI